MNCDYKSQATVVRCVNCPITCTKNIKPVCFVQYNKLQSCDHLLFGVARLKYLKSCITIKTWKIFSIVSYS